MVCDLYALVSSFGVVKAVEHEGGAKLTVIEKVTREFVVAIDPDIEAGQNSLDDPDVEIMRALGQHGTARGPDYRGLRRHTFAEACVVLSNAATLVGPADDLRWRSKVASIAGVKRCAIEGFVNHD